MKESHVEYLACPSCGENLSISKIDEKEGNTNRIRTGELNCKGCNSKYPIIGSIPRFVTNDNYAANFGHEWTNHSITQYDGYSGSDNTEKRLFTETKWPRDLKGQLVLEVGSGSGRFTELIAKTGAFVISMDYSFAVEANYHSNKNKENVFIVQGDIYSMPFKKRFFDKMMCLGVLQHTPDPQMAFMSMPPFLKNGGTIAVDVYRRDILRFNFVKYTVRYFTKYSKNPGLLYKRCIKYVDFMWPLASLIRRIPNIGSSINWRLLIADYSKFGLKGQILKEWAYLNTYDMLSPRYDFPTTIRTVKSWFKSAGLEEVEVHKGYNGIEGRGKVQWQSNGKSSSK